MEGSGELEDHTYVISKNLVRSRHRAVLQEAVCQLHQPNGKRTFEASSGIRHLVRTCSTEGGPDHTLDDVWVINIKQMSGDVEQTLRFGPPETLQCFRRYVSNFYTRRRQKPRHRKSVQVISLDTVKVYRPVLN